MFRVLADQLQTTEGWVRCGQCGNTFKAELHAGAESERISAIPAAEVDVLPEMGQLPSFMRSGHWLGFWWRHPLAQAFLALMVVLLSLALLLQVILHERNRIAAFDPGSRPALRQLCQWFGCDVLPWQDIERLVIDSSSFSKIEDGIYRLGFTLKNSADLSLAMPAFELTLTDLQEQAVLRKVLLPAELGDAPRVLRAGAEFSRVLTLELDADARSRLVGYRLLIFYP